MKILSIQPFVPSGADFERSKQLFQEIGFTITWDAGDYLGFEMDGCGFILQKFNNRSFAENFMLSVHVNDVEAFFTRMQEKNLVQKFGIRITAPQMQPYGKEVNLIDLAGVCWHFVQQ